MARGDIQARRKRALIAATVDEIGQAGTLEVTVGQIAKKAGVSSALAHHYFGSKEQLFLAAMRAILTEFGDEARAFMAAAPGPRARLDAVVRACFSPQNFRPEVVAAWLNFYVLAQTAPEANRLLRVYQRRLHSNLCHDLRPLVGPRAGEVARTVAALIDGLYIRQALRGPAPDGAAAIARVTAYLETALAAHHAREEPCPT